MKARVGCTLLYKISGWGAETSSSVWAPRLLRDLLRKQGCPVDYSVSQVQEERTKEDRALACSPAPIPAERRRSLWYATHCPTDERKVSRQDRGCLSFIFCFLSYCGIEAMWVHVQTQVAQFAGAVWWWRLGSAMGAQCLERKPQALSHTTFDSSLLPPEASQSQKERVVLIFKGIFVFKTKQKTKRSLGPGQWQPRCWDALWRVILCWGGHRGDHDCSHSLWWDTGLSMWAWRGTPPSVRVTVWVPGPRAQMGDS